MAIPFNPFPATYQAPVYYPPQPQMQPVQQPSRTVEVVPVESEDAAASWPVAVGATQMLVARDDSFVAFKTNGVNGQSSFIVYDKRPPAPPAPAFVPGEYLRKDELKSAVEAILAARGGADE